MFWKTFKSSSGVLFTYEDILLKLYIEVAKTGDFTLLVREGKCSDQDCLNAWEQIVKKQEKVTGSNQYNSVLQLMKGYASLLNDHTVIRACLIHLLHAPVDWEVLSTLKAKGYHLTVTDGVVNMEEVRNGLRRNENLITKATMKSKELQRMFQNKKEGESKGFEEILANLNFALGFNVDENITLARYNEYQKILKARAQQAEEAKNKSKFKK